MLEIFKNILGVSTDNRLKDIVKQGAYLVDVRTPAEFSQGSVRGAVNIPLDKIAGQLAKFKGKENIVVFCRSGARSSQAKGLLERSGFSNVTNGGTWMGVKQALES